MAEPRGLVLPLLLLSGLTVSRGAEQVTALTGTDVTFTALLSSPHTELNWYQGDSKIVDLEEGRAPDFYRQWGQRVIVDLHKATLILRNVTPADSGAYRAEPLDRGRLLPHVFFNLQVYNPVCAVIIRNVTEGNNMTLRCACSAPGAAPTSYRWYKGDTVGSTDPEIKVEKKDEPQEYRCNASNGVSWREATFMVPAIMPESQGNRTHYILILIVAVVVLFIGLLMGVWICQRKNRKYNPRNPEQNADESKQRNNTEVVDLEERANENTPLNRTEPWDPKQNADESKQRNKIELWHHKENADGSPRWNIIEGACPRDGSPNQIHPEKLWHHEENADGSLRWNNIEGACPRDGSPNQVHPEKLWHHEVNADGSPQRNNAEGACPRGGSPNQVHPEKLWHHEENADGSLQGNNAEGACPRDGSPDQVHPEKLWHHEENADGSPQRNNAEGACPRDGSPNQVHPENSAQNDDNEEGDDELSDDL